LIQEKWFSIRSPEVQTDPLPGGGPFVTVVEILVLLVVGVVAGISRTPALVPIEI
jgi:hypothetical protein